MQQTRLHFTDAVEINQPDRADTVVVEDAKKMNEALGVLVAAFVKGRSVDR